MQLVRFFIVFAGLASVFTLFVSDRSVASFEVSIPVLGASGQSQWDVARVSALPQKKLSEKAPGSKELKTWTGIHLRDLIEETAGKLPPEKNAEVDLVVVEDSLGKKAMIPRSFVNKYGVILSHNATEGWSVVPPWTSDKKAQKERLPLETFYMGSVNRITLTNYRNLYGERLFLKRRTDPLAMRGEKIFVQTCMGCHFQNAKAKPDEMAGKIQASYSIEKPHSPVAGFPDLDEKDWRALRIYTKASQEEIAAQTKKGFWDFLTN